MLSQDQDVRGPFLWSSLGLGERDGGFVPAPRTGPADGQEGAGLCYGAGRTGPADGQEGGRLSLRRRLDRDRENA